MSKKEKKGLKDIYDEILVDKVDDSQKTKTTNNSNATKTKLTIKEISNNCLKFIKNNYLSVEMIFVGFLLLCLGFIPAIKILSYQFLETLDVSVNFFDISGWIFCSTPLSTENAFLSVFSLFYILSSLAMIVVGVLILLNIIKKQNFLISSIMHFASVFLLMCFFITFAVWISIGKDTNLIATGIDTIYYNFSTIKIYTLIYFNLSVVMIAYTAVYIYHNRKNIFINNKK